MLGFIKVAVLGLAAVAIAAPHAHDHAHDERAPHEHDEAELLKRLVYTAKVPDLFDGPVKPSVDTASRLLCYASHIGFVHASIPWAQNQIAHLGQTYNMVVDFTEDPEDFNKANLAKYDGIIMLMNIDLKFPNGSVAQEVLNATQKDAFQWFLSQGGAHIGIHASTDGLDLSEFYIRESGARFWYHHQIQNATLRILDNTHPSTAHLPDKWQVNDEIFNFMSDPRDVGAVGLLQPITGTYNNTNGSPLDNTTYDQGEPHIISWYQDQGAGALWGDYANKPGPVGIGRSWYTCLGHSNSTWSDPIFLTHIMGGIKWAIGGNTTLFTNPKASIGNSPSGVNVANRTTVDPTPFQNATDILEYTTQLAVPKATTTSGASTITAKP